MYINILKRFDFSAILKTDASIFLVKALRVLTRRFIIGFYINI